MRCSGAGGDCCSGIEGTETRLVSGRAGNPATGNEGFPCIGAWAMLENLEEEVECGGEGLGRAIELNPGDLCSGVGAI